MGRDRERHQQLVGDDRAVGNAGDEFDDEVVSLPVGGFFPARWVSVALCVVTVLVALWLGAVLPHESNESAKADATEADATKDGPTEGLPKEGFKEGRAEENAGEGAGGEADAREPAAAPVSAGTFLARLERDAREQQDGEVSCTWTADEPIDDLAGDILRAYRDSGEARLVASGYLDLKGNAWGAIVLFPAGWVDMVVVTAGEDDMCATARIARSVAPSAMPPDGEE